jgi:hypothetical protein
MSRPDEQRFAVIVAVGVMIFLAAVMVWALWP